MKKKLLSGEPDMTMSSPLLPLDSWEISRRVEAWAGEIRVNLIRIIAIVIFYSRHLIEVMTSPKDAPIRGVFHLRTTAVVVAWAGVAGAVHLILSRRVYPPAMKFATALLDVLMITLLCAIADDSRLPRLTPLILLYFAAIASAPLRLSLPLVYVTTGACALGYLSLLAYHAWYLVGFHKYYESPELRIPRGHEVITLLSMLVAGFLAGQVVRQVRRMIERYPMIHPAEQNEQIQ
jgi:hypothetical protein